MQHRRDNDIVFQQLVKPSTTTSVVDDTTLTIGRGEKDVENGHHIASDGENIIKQVTYATITTESKFLAR